MIVSLSHPRLGGFLKRLAICALALTAVTSSALADITYTITSTASSTAGTFTVEFTTADYLNSADFPAHGRTDLTTIATNITCIFSRNACSTNEALINTFTPHGFLDDLQFSDNLGTSTDNAEFTLAQWTTDGSYTDYSGSYSLSVSSAAVPEPASLALLAGALTVGAAVTRQRKRQG